MRIQKRAPVLPILVFILLGGPKHLRFGVRFNGELRKLLDEARTQCLQFLTPGGINLCFKMCSSLRCPETPQGIASEILLHDN